MAPFPNLGAASTGEWSYTFLSYVTIVPVE